ncbi:MULTISPECIES: hypothetical protein [Spongiibacter]|uniref:hypothetical protein n=1 Tax=Spongiibacter TaxID=630749 RepID=UPI000C3C108B|nr:MULTISPECIES: hypothetical protein [Spongiibacter]MAY37789.1 hypothetical protein [Spongiibacter sp.]MBI57782.1 hypothetical protein [Spongiibacter sp.]MBO6751515.1 hypothetical protein [Spongiibacter sp.]MBU73218.1 hypothetical protein [Spongiibacter sp.]|tara:strand:+ start:10740 stop:11123 length:384 start_codon:yes stop_codon:yes gene_type:complete
MRGETDCASEREQKAEPQYGDLLTECLAFGAEEIERLQLRGQLLCLALLKMLIFALLSVISATSVWLLAMLVLARVMVQAGVPDPFAMSLLLLLNLLAFWYCQRQLRGALTGARPRRTAVEGQHAQR